MFLLWSDIYILKTVFLWNKQQVNEYPPGVGLSPHIDTHSAFEGLIFSLSLAGPCIMEFRKYNTGVWLEKPTSNSDVDNNQISEKSSNFIRKAIYLPPRSMLLLSGEARYAWHHYIPHHKVRFVNTCVVCTWWLLVQTTRTYVGLNCTILCSQ